MGNYLNARTAYDAYRRECGSPYFVDKSRLLDELIQRMERYKIGRASCRERV